MYINNDRWRSIAIKFIYIWVRFYTRKFDTKFDTIRSNVFYRIKDTNSYKVNRASLDKYNSNVAVTFNLTKYHGQFFLRRWILAVYTYILKYVKIIFPSFVWIYIYMCVSTYKVKHVTILLENHWNISIIYRKSRSMLLSHYWIK